MSKAVGYSGFRTYG